MRPVEVYVKKVDEVYFVRKFWPRGRIVSLRFLHGTPCLLPIAVCSARYAKFVIKCNPNQMTCDKIGESTEVALLVGKRSSCFIIHADSILGSSTLLKDKGRELAR